MRAKTARKIRREVARVARQSGADLAEVFRAHVASLPLRARLRLAWRIVRGRV